MLEPVAAQRSGGAFVVPGLFQDARGIVVSSDAAIVVHSQDQLQALLRIVSDESSLIELLSGLHIEELRSSVGGQGYMLRLRVSDSRVLDRLARAAAFCGGQLSVGAGRHFVRYRDAQSPYGYDALSIVAGSDGDYVVYAPQTTVIYGRAGQLSLQQLCRKPRLLPRLGGHAAALRAHDPREPLWLLVPSLLLPRLLRYLWLRQIEAAVMLPQPGSSTLTAQHTLLRVPGEVARSPGALQGLPGLRWLSAITDHIAVELGYAHPLNLQSLASLFSDDERHLFLADPPGLLSLPASPFVPARHVVRLEDVDAPGTAAHRDDRQANVALDSAGFGDRLQPARVALRLVQAIGSPQAAAAALVPWSQIARLAKLSYLLPPNALAKLQAAALRDGLLVVGDVSYLPLGDLFYEAEAGSQLLVPLGLTLVPRISAAALRAQLEAGADRWLLVQPAQSASRGSVDASTAARRDRGERIPLSLHELPTSALRPLGQQLVLRLTAQPLELLDLAALASEPNAATAANEAPQAVYGSLGWLWPLWGGPRLAANPALLPAASAPLPPADDSDEDQSS